MTVNVWGIHAEDDNLFLNGGVIAIGYEIGDASKIKPDRDSFKKAYKRLHPEAKAQSIGTKVGMVYRFVYEAQVGDYVVYPSKVDKLIHIGKITGDYKYVSNSAYMHQRSVEWLYQYKRTDFSQGALHEVGSFLTFFMIKRYPDEFINHKSDNVPVNSKNDDNEDSDTPYNKIDSALEQLDKRLSDELFEAVAKIDDYAFERLVTKLVEKMGYGSLTKVTKKSGDGGIDGIVNGDKFGFDKVCIQAKHWQSDSSVGSPEIRNFSGSLDVYQAKKGVFITTAKFSKSARDEVKRINGPNKTIALVDGNRLIDLMIEHNLGVFVSRTYEVKTIDTDFFDEGLSE